MNFGVFKKHSPRRAQVRKNIAADRAAKRKKSLSPHSVNSALLWMLFVALSILVLTIGDKQITVLQAVSIVVIAIFVSIAGGFYVYNYQQRIVQKPIRAVAIIILLITLIAIVKAFSFVFEEPFFATGTAATFTIIIAIAYDQRFAIGMSVFYCLLATFAVSLAGDMRIFLIMASTSYACCVLLREVRTREKLLQVGAIAAVVAFITSLSIDFLTNQNKPTEVLTRAFLHGMAPMAVSIILQGLLPYLERVFGIATSMTLVEYSDANQELLKKLAMEAPGTFSHSLMVGSIAEAAAEAIGRNGLLCRVGAYYHDIGKTNKPYYFVENQVGSTSKHDDLSPAMSQLIITGHVKDGKEIAKEYKLPAVLRQFIETHHGTTLVEYFYDQAKKKAGDKEPAPAESEYRYIGPRPRTKEAAIVMLADAIESAVRSLQEITPAKIEAVIRNVAMKRLQDGQLNECDMTFRELARVQASMIKTLTAHYHGRIVYPQQPDQTPETEQNIQDEKTENSRANSTKT
ncbi:MAG: HDIG domain-containing protein [Sedimentisphaerales bacterium]|nr:HDIG domain-containing protein [Sedimentisphaerales bacterium]